MCTDQVGKGYLVPEREGSWEDKWMAIKEKRSRAEMNRSTQTGIKRKQAAIKRKRSPRSKTEMKRKRDQVKE